MLVFVLNTGSSSLKYQLFDMPGGKVLASGLVERIGETVGKIAHKKMPGSPAEEVFTKEEPIANHKVGLSLAIGMLTDAQTGVIAKASDIDAIGHRVVHGGEAIHESCLIDETVKEHIKAFVPLAPLHNPPGLTGIETAEELFPGVPQIGVFDTAFHAHMEPKQFLYAVPYSLYEELKVRRYGFHGTSHAYVAKRAAQFLGTPYKDVSLITVHLGNGCSISAVKDGHSIDTSMGMTPLAGVMMGTRSGDVDPSVCAYLNRERGLSIAEIDDMLNKKSGLKGICGLNDMRDIHAAREKGDQKAQLAFEMFCLRITKYIGAFAAELGRLDGIVFTAGIGENDDFVRAEVCKSLGIIGAEIDLDKNKVRSREERRIDAGSKVAIMVIPTNEELEIALQVVSVLEKK